MRNSDISDKFNELAGLLEIKGENVFRIRAYRNAAASIMGLTKNVSDMAGRGEDLTQIPGVGKDLGAKIKEIVETGKLKALSALQKELPAGLFGLMQVQGLGPKRVKALYEVLGVKSIEELETTAKSGRLRKLSGFGPKTENNILREIERLKSIKGKLRLDEAEDIAVSIVSYLKKALPWGEVIVAGSYRRGKEVIGDIDILAAAPSSQKLMAHFIAYEDASGVVSQGPTRSTIELRSGTQVDLRVVGSKSYGAALQYFTGSLAHNVAVRKLAVQKGLKINEYGVFRAKNSLKPIAGQTEADVYKQVGLCYIEPELRENLGEIEAAAKNALPRLISLKDIKGDLHTHTNLTDGHNTLEEMVEASRAKGYSYIANTEHSKWLTVVRGLDGKALVKWIKEIDAFNRKVKGFRVLKSLEVDILEDGSLDLEDEFLKELDLTVCAVHSKFNLASGQQTERIIRAMDNRYFNILAHPTGRLINQRPAYEVDMEKIISAAFERGCILEQNAHPMRLDLNDTYCKLAKQMKAKIAISTDAHSVADLDYARFGLLQARRGWIEPEDVVNTRDLDGLLKLLKRR